MDNKYYKGACILQKNIGGLNNLDKRWYIQEKEHRIFKAGYLNHLYKGMSK